MTSSARVSWRETPPSKLRQIGGYRVQRIRRAVTVGNETRVPGQASQPVVRRVRIYQPSVGLCRASAMRLRAQRREVLPNMPASLRSDSG